MIRFGGTFLKDLGIPVNPFGNFSTTIFSKTNKYIKNFSTTIFFPKLPSA